MTVLASLKKHPTPQITKSQNINFRIVYADENQFNVTNCIGEKNVYHTLFLFQILSRLNIGRKLDNPNLVGALI